MKISVQNYKSNDKHYKTDNTTGFTQTNDFKQQGY